MGFTLLPSPTLATIAAGPGRTGPPGIGRLGKIPAARAWIGGSRPDIGKAPDAAVPAGVDYDLWPRPAPERAFSTNRFHLVRAGGLADVTEAFTRLPLAVDDLLAASFPAPGGAEEFRRAGAEDVGRDRIGLGFHDRDGWLFVSFPSAVFGGTRPG